MVHIHCKLICSYLCSTEQKNFEEQQWIVYFYDRSRLVSEWEKGSFGVSGSRVAGSMPVF